MKYCVTIQFERTQQIIVEADSKEEAIEIVEQGEFEDKQIAEVNDDHVEILGAMLESENKTA